jgi:hypothetical protein
MPTKHASEIGVAGNASRMGWVTTGEHLRSLDGATGRAVYDKMRRSDHQVRAVLSAIKLPIRQADYYIEAGSKSEQDVEIAKTLQRALLEEMSLTWDDTIRHALLMLEFGFSALEKVYEYRDGLQLPKKLDPRLPQSVVRWKCDASGRTTHMVQQDTGGKLYEIPIDKLLVFTTDREGDNWEGMSILRPAYKAWFIKDQLEKTNAIMHDRWGVGIPTFDVPAPVTRNSEEWNAGVEALEDVHAGEKAFQMVPFGWKFGIMGGKDGQGTDVLESIKYYDEAIAKAMLAMHINLGTTSSGSRALGASFIDAFLMATQAWADYIAEVIDRFCLREIVDLNWKVENYPHLKVRRIPGLNLDAIGFLAQSGIITRDSDLENSLRDVLRIPHKDEDMEPPVPEPEPAEDEDLPEEAVPDGEMVALRKAAVAAVAKQLAEGVRVNNLRVPGKAEMFKAFMAHRKGATKLDEQEAAIYVEAFAHRLSLDMAARAVALQRAGTTGRELVAALTAAASRVRPVAASAPVALSVNVMAEQALIDGLGDKLGETMSASMDRISVAAEAQAERMERAILAPRRKTVTIERDAKEDLKSLKILEEKA